jgi:hypothetical protein
MYSLVDANYHYIRNGDGTEELYNYELDPAEASNLAGNATFAAVLQSFRETLQILVTDPPPTREEPVFHPVPPPPGG